MAETPRQPEEEELRPAPGTVIAPVLGQSLLGAWRGLRNIGDQIERKHFDGDFLGSVSEASRQVGERGRRIGEELGTAAEKLVEELQGKAGAEDAATGEPWSVRCEASSSSTSSSPARPPAALPPGGAEVSCGPSSAALWDTRERLEGELNKEREMRRGRSMALAAMDDALRGLRTELLAVRRELAEAEDSRAVALKRTDEAERALEELREEHEEWQVLDGACQAELARYAQAAASAARAEREAARRGAWARDGPETDALRDAKMALADILSLTDEAGLGARRQRAELQREIDEAKAENALLRLRAEQEPPPPGGLRASISRLFGGGRAAGGPAGAGPGTGEEGRPPPAAG